MLELTIDDIILNQSFNDKIEAIQAIASDLSSKGYVEDGYVEGMLEREAQHSTYLGNGIAIPHGTTQTRGLVQQTGVSLHHFPQGISWGDGNIVYVAIGIAAQSDEHLGILKQLTHVLSNENVELLLKQASTKDQLIAILNGDVQSDKAQSRFSFSASLVQREFPATDMIQMSAVASGLLRNQGCVDAEFISDVINKAPTSLGDGLWLVSSDCSVNQTGMAFVSAAQLFEMNNQPVKALLVISACNHLHQPVLEQLTELVFSKQQKSLFALSEDQLVALFVRDDNRTEDMSGDAVLESNPMNSELVNSGEFTIRNAHGLHARPGAMLVAEAKKFESTIKVANLNGDKEEVNAKSLMKVISLGVKHGYTLKFTADGADSKQAIEAIGKAIQSGLGEG
ncbi:fused PTS fructose transporter subunit IIA/HPr protein [Vibrio genomosp. F10]|uniref:Bifunctional PTS fructose transporter subunit IIA/HPr protein n=1 Tax=Vibrio genomosp. F10 TaxID=723171 RepID=A0A1B9R154_9VIBR|nr:fused PTS fructose transporter subunit IIA/HPr protein [Vibrio genomosp. F10]OCH77915.1 bifunctional PTS fructose transporter subunit IIA/HPr protein [Vibrio genomosp. F10]